MITWLFINSKQYLLIKLYKKKQKKLTKQECKNNYCLLRCSSLLFQCNLGIILLIIIEMISGKELKLMKIHLG